MARLSLRHVYLLALSLLLCGCTVVISKGSGEKSTAVSQASVEPAYATSLPTPTHTANPTATATVAVATPTATVKSTPTESAYPTATVVISPSAVPENIVHIVSSGDTLSEIAEMYGVSEEAIIAANNLENPNKLSVGQKLVIPNPQATIVATATAKAPTAIAAAATAKPTIVQSPVPPTQPTVGRVRVSETTVTINICNFENGLVPLKPEDVGYPYDSLDTSRVGTPSPRQYRAIVLENDYLAVTIVPDLGGRIYQFLDKVNNKQLLYNNPSVIASTWGMRGWWLAVGGIEWSLPTEEHGLVEYLPWQANTNSSANEASVELSLRERLTGVDCRIRLTLPADRNYLVVEPSLSNTGNSAQRLQFWTNAMFAPGGTKVDQKTHLVFPASRVTIHNTSDPGLPAAGQAIPWPLYGPRDLSVLENWHGFLGAFAQPNATFSFMGAQQPGAAGLLRIFPPQIATGAKFFGLGDIPTTRYSNTDSDYLELWGGLTPTFWDYQDIAAGQTISWKETWFPLPDMPAILAANNEAALAFDSQKRVAIVATGNIAGVVETYDKDKRSINQWPVTLKPGETWTSEPLSANVAAIELKDKASGSVILRWPQ